MPPVDSHKVAIRVDPDQTAPQENVLSESAHFAKISLFKKWIIKTAPALAVLSMRLQQTSLNDIFIYHIDYIRALCHEKTFCVSVRTTMAQMRLHMCVI